MRCLYLVSMVASYAPPTMLLYLASLGSSRRTGWGKLALRLKVPYVGPYRTLALRTAINYRFRHWETAALTASFNVHFLFQHLTTS